MAFLAPLLAGLVASPADLMAAVLRLSWVDRSDGEAAFRIERRGEGQPYEELAIEAPGVTTHVDASVVEGARYCYRVQAFNEAGRSPYSNEACGRAPGGLVLRVALEGARHGTVTSEPPGIDCAGDCRARYPAGTVVTLSAVPGPRGAFAGWRGGGCAGAGPCTITGNAAVTVRAAFEPVPRHRLSVTRQGPGAVTATPGGLHCGEDCAASYPAGTVVALTASPARGARFLGWGGACGGTGACSVTLDAATSVTARFEKDR